MTTQKRGPSLNNAKSDLVTSGNTTNSLILYYHLISFVYNPIIVTLCKISRFIERYLLFVLYVYLQPYT